MKYATLSLSVLGLWVISCTTSLHANYTPGDGSKNLVRHSDFSTTTRAHDTLFLCSDICDGIAYSLKEQWESGIYDKYTDARPVIVMMDIKTYEEKVIPRIGYESKDLPSH